MCIVYDPNANGMIWYANEWMSKCVDLRIYYLYIQAAYSIEYIFVSIWLSIIYLHLCTCVHACEYTHLNDHIYYGSIVCRLAWEIDWKQEHTEKQRLNENVWQKKRRVWQEQKRGNHWCTCVCAREERENGQRTTTPRMNECPLCLVNEHFVCTHLMSRMFRHQHKKYNTFFCKLVKLGKKVVCRNFTNFGVRSIYFVLMKVLSTLW